MHQKLTYTLEKYTVLRRNLYLISSMSKPVYPITTEDFSHRCHPQPKLCCPFLSLHEGVNVCVRYTLFEQTHFDDRLKQALIADEGFCTGQPFFLPPCSPPKNYDFMAWIREIDGKPVQIIFTYFYYLFYIHQAAKMGIPLEEYLLKLAKDSLA